MLDLSVVTIAVPFILGSIVLLIPKRFSPLHGIVASITSIWTLVLTWILFTKIPVIWSLNGSSALLRIDTLAGFVGLFTGLFGVLVTLYSNGFMSGKQNLNSYYAYILWTLGASIGAAYSNNLILLLIFWGFLGLTLYLLISMGGPESAAGAKKTFIIVGGSDAVMLFGVGILWYLVGGFGMDSIKLKLGSNMLGVIAFLSLAAGAFAKAGAMPLHTWIPDCSETAPTPVMAFLPASLDKLLGIYLLARLVLDMFVITPGSGLSTLLLGVGAVTIIAAVMMALVQHNLKRLLAYHAVSQVGYMVLGIGTANPIGIAGGLFHMVNHAIYKTCLFLSGGSVEKKAGTVELDELGGLAQIMPITFTTFLIASLAISGVPPLNGFFSKWMVYQSLIEMGKAGYKWWTIWLVVAMFGSALTLASFMKLLYTTFLSPKASAAKPKAHYDEVSPLMWLPQVALAVLCVLFGIFAVQIPIKLFIAPSVNNFGPISYMGIWNAPLATLLIVAGIVFGALFFIIGQAIPAKRSKIFIGGELLDDNSGISGGSFYNTVKDMPFIGRIYKLAEKKVFDIYEEGSKGTFLLTDFLRWLHNGILPTYMVWCLVGMLVLFFLLVR